MKTGIKLILTSLLVTTISTSLAQANSLENFLEKRDLKGKMREELAALDVNFSADLGDIDLIDGVNLAAKYRYEVEASYQDQYFTRIDKWDVRANINVGDVVENFVQTPLSFSINRENSFFFVRQFKEKSQALKALPYSPKRLPLNADLALSNLEVGDFVSMPAVLNIAVEARTTAITTAPIVLDAHAGVYLILSGEFVVQVFKIDQHRVRLKLISRRGFDYGANGGAKLSFQFFGVRILDKQIDRLFERDLVQYGYVFNPGSQFIVDYTFDLRTEEAKAAYNQILGTTLKFKDVAVINQFDGQELKDKLISSFEKAEKIFEADKELAPKDRRVSRIFKGFNNYKGHTNKLKLSVLLARFNKDRAYTENQITYIDKNENNLKFFYPTFSKYIETRVGKWIFKLKDQSFQNNFGLIPRLNNESVEAKDPDFGLTFERKDNNLTTIEQRSIARFMTGQIPAQFAKSIDYSEWQDGENKKDTRIFFQLILKSQGMKYLRNYSKKEITDRLIAYSVEKKKQHIFAESDSALKKLKDFLFIGRFIKNERLNDLGEKIHYIINAKTDSEKMTKELVKLNEHGIFDKIGVGFFISLMPQEELKELVYFKISMIGRDLKPINYEYGKLNYRALYDELTRAQSRILDRSYDLRITEEDQMMENRDLSEAKDDVRVSLDEISALN